MIHLEFYIQVSRWLSASVPTDGPQARSTAVRSAIAGARGQLRTEYFLQPALWIGADLGQRSYLRYKLVTLQFVDAYVAILQCISTIM
jgi:hypothetical protein